jgi:hypothetical protein
MVKQCLAIALFFVVPSLLFWHTWGRHPEASEGCLAIARHDRVGDVSPSLLFCRPDPLFFVTPRLQPRGLPLNHLLKPDEQLFKEIQKGNESSKEGKPYSDQPLKKG